MHRLQYLKEEQDKGIPIYVCYGGGVDSTAMLCALKHAGIVPDLITMANTGGEKPETYQYVRYFSAVIKVWGFPEVSWCKKIPTDRVPYTTLEGNCTDNETLPSLAFGMKSCSIKWKQVPQDYFVKGCLSGPNKCDPHPTWVRAQALGVKPIKLIGYDAGKADIRRSKRLKSDDPWFRYEYPLQILGWEREQCMEAIAAEGLPVPIKSACFYCPASKKWELWWLAGTHPHLLERSLEMEYKALTGHHSRFDEIEFGDSWWNLVQGATSFPSSNTTVGLGRSMSWNQWAFTNGLVDKNRKFIGDRAECLRMSDELRGKGGNAADQRGCPIAP